ncbi:MAG TPA: NAD(+) diphosphatase [Candidatus Binatia bacterium]
MNVFAGNPLDRAQSQRLDDAWLAAGLEDPGSRFLPLWKLEVLVKKDGSGLAWAKRGLLSRAGEQVRPILLGIRDGVAHYAVDVSALAEPARELGLLEVAHFIDVRAVAGQLASADSAIVAQARSLVDWHATHPFCARCGAATTVAQGGAMRVCDRCRAEHFPRVNPVVIMLVVRGDHCLLGRQAAWPRGMYSTLAGFVETGETIEEAVRREVREESGIEVGSVRYHSSQPWPFPSSLMIGCVAEATSEDVRIDSHEIEDARWFSRATIERVCRGESDESGLMLPPVLAIGRRLCDDWAGLTE